MVFIAESWEEIKKIAETLDKKERAFILKTKPQIKVIPESGRVHYYYQFYSYDVPTFVVAIPGNFHDEAHYGWLLLMECCKS